MILINNIIRNNLIFIKKIFKMLLTKIEKDFFLSKIYILV